MKDKSQFTEVTNLDRAKDKVDKGFELRYYRLSYRRRFIRTLWLIPWAVLVLGLLYRQRRSIYLVILAAIIFGVIGFIQAYHNYKKWKAEEI